jgi:hypothetical protein
MDLRVSGREGEGKHGKVLIQCCRWSGRVELSQGSSLARPVPGDAWARGAAVHISMDIPGRVGEG